MFFIIHRLRLTQHNVVLLKQQ